LAQKITSASYDTIIQDPIQLGQAKKRAKFTHQPPSDAAASVIAPLPRKLHELKLEQSWYAITKWCHDY